MKLPQTERGSLYRRILIFILPITILFIIGLATWSYYILQKEAIQHFDSVRETTEAEIVNAIQMMDAGYRMLENRLEKEMRPSLKKLLEAYKKSGGNPAKMDLPALKQNMPEGMDIYIIDANAIIRWTTDVHGRGFNFRHYGLGKTMQAIRMGNSIAHERVRTNMLTGSLGDWLYAPTPDHRYILEVGYGGSRELDRIADDLDPAKVAKRLEQLSPYVESVRIYDVFGYAFSHKAGEPYAPDKALQKRIRKVMQYGRLVNKAKDTIAVDRYIDLGALKKTISNPGKIVRIRFTSAPLHEYLKDIIEGGFASVLLLVTVLSFLILLLARRLTRPLSDLQQLAQLVMDGDLSRRAHVLDNDETGKLAIFFNQMLDRVAANTLELEQKVEDRTGKYLQAKERADASNKDKSRFLAAASHDLRQPLYALNLYLETLGTLLDNDRQKGLLNKAKQSGETLRGLLNGLLDVSQLDVGGIVPHISTVDLPVLLNQLVEEWQPQAQEKGLTFRWRECTCRIAVCSDPLLLARMLRNFLSNAVRYCEQGGILIACRKRGSNIRIGVWDTGMGIALQEMENVFSEFHQLHNPERDRNKGLGLGLSIVRRLSQLLDHPVHVRSVLGRGSYFSVDVPMADAVVVRQQKSVIAARGGLPVPEISGRLIVTVDDDVDILDAIGELLGMWGCKVLLAEDGDAAVRQLQEIGMRRPDVVIADYRLRNGHTGIEAVQHLRRMLDDNIAAIIITGETAEEVTQQSSDAGCMLLHKPVQPVRLRSLLHYCIESRS